MARLALLITTLSSLAACNIEAMKKEYRDSEIKRVSGEHPTWKRHEVESIVDGNFWKGMTEEQAKYYMDLHHPMGSDHDRGSSFSPEFYTIRCHCRSGRRGSYYWLTSLTISTSTLRVVDWYSGG
jgi:hypothetical protein